MRPTAHLISQDTGRRQMDVLLRAASLHVTRASRAAQLLEALGEVAAKVRAVERDALSTPHTLRRPAWLTEAIAAAQSRS
jgi:Ser/Thr protein kinase RdoA (MazF antagonist)